jgi:hypothetical protein
MATSPYRRGSRNFSGRGVTLSKKFHLTFFVSQTRKAIKKIISRINPNSKFPISCWGGYRFHTCCNTGSWFSRSHPKDCPIQSPLTTHKRMASCWGGDRSNVSKQMWHDKYNLDPRQCSKVLSAEHRLKFTSLHREWWHVHMSEIISSRT